MMRKNVLINYFYNNLWLVIIFICSFDCFSGSLTNNQFTIINNSITDSSLVNYGGLALGVKEYANLKMYGDSLSNISDFAISTEILQRSDTIFIFFTDTLYKNISCRKYKLIENGLTPLGNWTKFCDADVPADCYLHAEQGESGNLVSFIRKGTGSKKILRLNNGSNFLDIDSVSSSGWLYSAQCYLKNDTFLIAYSVDMSSLHLAKVYSNGSIVQKVASGIVATGMPVPGESIMNCSVAFDGEDAIIVTWNKGSPRGNKYLQMRFYNRNLVPGITDSLDQIVSDTNYYFYDNAGIASYGLQKFAVFFWNKTGLLISRLALNGAVVNKNTEYVATGNYKYCTATSNKKYLLVACKGDLNNDGISCIEGIRYQITGGNFGEDERFTFSNNSVSILDPYSTAINCTMDTSGTMGVTWKNQYSNQGSVFAYRGIRFLKGFWTSPVESLDVAFQDSIRFYPISKTVSDLSSWYIQDSIRVGCTIQECTIAQWKPFSDTSILNSLKSTCRYYQYRIKINRKNGAGIDSLSTPIISDATISWNVKPMITTLDSIAIRNIIRTGVSFGNSVNVLSRIDTLRLFTKIRDQDQGDLISIKGSWPANDFIENLSSTGVEAKAPVISLYPLPKDTTVSCTLSVWDSQGWKAQPKTLKLIARNALPQLSAKIFISGHADSIKVTNDTIYNIQESDTIDISYAVSDTNDVSAVNGKISRKTEGGFSTVDAVTAELNGYYRIICDTVKPIDSLQLILEANDPDTIIRKKVSFTINHSPIINSIETSLRKYFNHDTIGVKAGVKTSLYINVHDTDLIFWDSLNCKMIARSFTDSTKTKKNKISFDFIPSIADSQIVFIVQDKSGKRDSFQLFLKMPWFETDSLFNSGYCKAKDTLQRCISLIAGSQNTYLVNIPFLNSGNDTMNITNLYMKGKSNAWLSLLYLNDTVPSEKSYKSSPIVLAPGNAIYLKILLSGQFLTGDSIVTDTVVVNTDDPSHSEVTIPVRLEYNDLPFIVDIKADYNADIPYWGLKKSKQINQRAFPPQASIQISFSEPVDSVSVLSGLRLYSILDYQKTGKIDPINLKFDWSQSYTKVDIYSNYEKESPYFEIFPPKGLFIPTDSLILVLTNAITDRASTPSGPNMIDIHRDFQKVSYADTTIQMRVDSSTFTLLNISPVQGDTAIGYDKPEITLIFSAPVYAASVDTAKENNRSLIVRSKYNNNQSLPYDKITIDNNKVIFRIGRKLFYNDSLFCLYRSVSIRDYSGFSIDNNHNGIAEADYDSLSANDNIEWTYRVKDNRIISFTPENRSTVNQTSPLITIKFSDPIMPGTFDTDTSTANKSIQIGSLYSAGFTNYSSINFSSDSTSIIVQPSMNFFSNDSIYCNFTGFSSNYNYNLNSNLPVSPNRLFSGLQWYFFTGNTGFYTFPNPYKPGKDPRHCNANGPCGIWFKNLHVLKRGINDVVIKIFDINSNPVFDSRKKGISIHFEYGKQNSTPQWLWNTRNMHNEYVASGLYLYVIYDMEGHALVKDKLIIVR